MEGQGEGAGPEGSLIILTFYKEIVMTADVMNIGKGSEGSKDAIIVSLERVRELQEQIREMQWEMGEIKRQVVVDIFNLKLYKYLKVDEGQLGRDIASKRF